jgi:uncharacterized protein with NRDE domain
MCLVALAIAQHRRFPLVIAGNRDEFFERPAARLGWWQPPPGAPADLAGDAGAASEILGGRDLQAGGTWMGLTRNGRLALVTNIRTPGRQDPDAPSRGHIVPRWLTSPRSPDQRWVQLATAGYNPFNLIAADFAAGGCWWASSGHSAPMRLTPGIYGLSNGLLDAPWPKVLKLKAQLARLLDAAAALPGPGSAPDTALEGLITGLFAALADRSGAADHELPATGVGLEMERALSPVFVHTADGRYGTRCSTLVITERTGQRLVTHMLERTFPGGPGLALLRHIVLDDWPVRLEAQGPATALIGGMEARVWPGPGGAQ